MSSIPEFPEDTLLDLTKHLDVADLISLLSTCRAIRKAQLHKTLWIDALIRIRDIERQPYPLSNVKDLSTLSLHQLQRAAYQANQLMKNWRSDNPRPTSIRHFELPLEPWDQYFCLPGTPFIVTDTEGCMDCWDFRTGERVAHLEIPGLYLGKVRPCMEEEGKALICGSTGYGHKRLVAICIDYRDHAHVLLSHVVSPPTPLVDGWNWEPFYINPGIAGFSGRGYTMTWSMDPNAQPLQHEHEFEGEQTATYSSVLLGQNLYLVSQRSIVSDVLVQRLPLFIHHHGPEPTQDSMASTVISNSYPLGSDREPVDMYSPHVCVPRYGVLAVTCGHYRWEGHHRFVIHFWPGETAERDMVVNAGNNYYYEERDHIRSWAVGHSGTSWFVRYPPMTTSDCCISVRPQLRRPHSGNWISIGDTIALDSVSEIALDDSLGTLFVLTKQGHMTAFSYT